MLETRQEKYKEYRNSLGKTNKESAPLEYKEDTITSEEILSSKPIKTPSSTSIISFDEIMKDTQNKEVKKVKTKYSFFDSITVKVVILILGLIIVGVLIFLAWYFIKQ